MRRVEVEQPAVCDRCGGEAFRPATRREQLARWFTHGRGASTAWYCRSCGASWSGGSAWAVLYRGSGSGWRRWVRLPVEVVAALRAARSWQPVPIFYAVVVAVALVPAVAVALFTPVRWWLALVGIPTVAVAGAFVWSLVSGVGRWRREVMGRLAPERAWRQDAEEEFAALREQVDRFRLLVPDGWSGVLTLGGTGWTLPPRGPRVLHELTVVADQGDTPPGSHGGVSDGPELPRVEIRLTPDPRGFPEELAVTELADQMLQSAWPDLDEVDQTDRREVERRSRAAHRDHERQREERETVLARYWRDGTVVIDGQQVQARMLIPEDTDVGVTMFDLDGQAVLVVAHGVDLNRLTLTTAVDAAALIGEFERRRRRMLDQSAS